MITLNDVQSPLSIGIVDDKKVILIGDYYIPFHNHMSDQDAERIMRIMEFYYKFGFMAAVRQMAKIQE